MLRNNDTECYSFCFKITDINFGFRISKYPRNINYLLNQAKIYVKSLYLCHEAFPDIFLFKANKVKLNLVALFIEHSLIMTRLSFPIGESWLVIYILKHKLMRICQGTLPTSGKNWLLGSIF